MKSKRTRDNRLMVWSTSRYPMEEVWPLCRTALESMERGLIPGQTMPPIIVKLTNCWGHWRGRGSWTEWNDGVRWQRILVRIGKPELFTKPIPGRYGRFKGDMPEYEIRSYREAIVHLTAHEMEHALGTSGRKSGEFRCELAAVDAVDYYRKHQEEIDREIEHALAVRAIRSAPKAKPTADQKKAAKLAKNVAMLAKWKRKFTIAKNKVRKYERAIKRASNISVAPSPAERIALAAKGPNEQP